MRNMLHERELQAEALIKGSNKMMNIMLELMLKTGSRPEQINAIKAELNEQQIQALLSLLLD